MRITKSYLISLLLLVSIKIGLGQDFKTVGYYPTYRFHTLDQIELDRVTHLNIAFANPDRNGQLQTDGVSITHVVQKAHEAGLKVFIALAGGAAKLADWKDWITPDNRSAFISDIMGYVTSHNLQGVDVDIEWSTVNDDYSGFVLELRDSIDQYGLEMSAALPGIYRYPEISDEALAAFDWINLMVYDLTGPWAPNSPGPHSPYSFAENSIDYWLNQGLEKNRMTLGVPFYGYDFTNQNNVKSVTFAGMVNLDEAHAELDQVGAIYYNGLPTITQKTELALQELSGIMIWELGQDHFGEFSLLKRIDETIEAFFVSSTVEHELASLTLFPNPVVEDVHLRLNSPQDFEITLYTQSLKVLQKMAFKNQSEVSIHMSQYPKGMYFLSIKGAEYLKTVKVVK